MQHLTLFLAPSLRYSYRIRTRSNSSSFRFSTVYLIRTYISSDGIITNAVTCGHPRETDFDYRGKANCRFNRTRGPPPLHRFIRAPNNPLSFSRQFREFVNKPAGRDRNWTNLPVKWFIFRVLATARKWLFFSSFPGDEINWVTLDGSIDNSQTFRVRCAIFLEPITNFEGSKRFPNDSPTLRQLITRKWWIRAYQHVQLRPPFDICINERFPSAIRSSLRSFAEFERAIDRSTSRLEGQPRS